jgi:hypothetical protein
MVIKTGNLRGHTGVQGKSIQEPVFSGTQRRIRRIARDQPLIKPCFSSARIAYREQEG